jgi:gliding motility-associated-like protein
VKTNRPPNLKISCYLWLLAILLFSLNGVAQREGNFWHFGDFAALDFNSGEPVFLDNSAMYQREGCASISDSNGQLMFYTNGIKVWNRLNQAMGIGQLLSGGQSATQSAIIAKKPGNNRLYYIFTVPDLDISGTRGLRYTVVDMDANNGFGDFTQTMNATLNAAPTEEKITAVKHANNQDIWIITHLWNTDTFYAFLLTEQGIDKDHPVISHSGIIHSGVNMAGYMKASPDGSKLAIITKTNNSLQLFHFNNLSGEIDQPITFLSNYPGGYGIEFSPSGRLLYITDYLSVCKVVQFDLTLPENEMINSGIVVGTVPNTYIGALQLAPDRKIYISKFDSTSSNHFVGDKYLGAISFPEERGLACGFVQDALDLGTKRCLWGLPTFVQSYFFQLQDFSATTSCAYDTTYFTITNHNDLNGVLWDFGDPASGTENQSDSLQPSHVYTTGGDYNVRLISYFAANTDTIYKKITIHPVPQIDLGVDRSFCSNDSLVLYAGDRNNTYLWQDGSTDSIFNVNYTGVYKVTVTNAFGCHATDSVSLIRIESPVVNLGNDTLLYTGETLELQINPNYTSYLWNTGDTLSHLTISAPGEYWADVDNQGCRSSDTIVVFFESNCHLYCPTAFTPNGDGMNDSFAPLSNEALSDYHLNIRNRWGTVVFESADISITWDGTFQGSLVEAGVYAWIIEYKCMYSHVPEAKTGTVMVLK